jgi:hypothetical protein
MYFGTKSYLKNIHNHTAKHALKGYQGKVIITPSTNDFARPEKRVMSVNYNVNYIKIIIYVVIYFFLSSQNKNNT